MKIAGAILLALVIFMLGAVVGIRMGKKIGADKYYSEITRLKGETAASKSETLRLTQVIRSIRLTAANATGAEKVK